MNKEIYTPVIGLEVHVELKTKSKMFCSCSADYFGHEPNTHTCPVCLGLPGALPVPNKTAIEWCIIIGLALNCEIPLFSKFDRKNYFYPDLPKGYQISQYDEPFCKNGHVILNSFQDPKHVEMLNQVQHDKKKRIRIRRVHMEEDTGKLIHATVNSEDVSLIDFNRSGVPLVEIVTEPDFSSALEVVEYLKKIQQIVRYLRVSNADMEKGDMRLEPNISLVKVSLRGVENDEANSNRSPRFARDDKSELPKYKVEVKNINSFKFVEKAISYEIKRQTGMLNRGETPTQETRGWDEYRQKTVSQRTKEEAHDYRYFPEPDIPPFRWNKSQIRYLADQLSELPDQKFERFVVKYKLSGYDSEILTRDLETANYFEESVQVNEELKAKNESSLDTKTIANWIINKKVDIENILPAQLIQQILSATQTMAINNVELDKLIAKVLQENQKAVEDYKKGKATVVMFLVGQVMRKIKEKIDANIVKKAIEKQLKTA